MPAQGAPGDAQHSSRRWWALIAIAASVLVVGLDLTVLNLALPNIAVSLHASTGDLQWFSDAYSLVIAAMILPAGLLGDRYGRKRVLLVALVLFGAASALCAVATSTGELIGARALLGVGASAIFPMSLSVLPTMFAPEERRKAIAIMSAATMLSFPIGPILGGYLLDHFWWGSVFLINVPVVVIALVAVVFLLPESRSANRPSIDVLGVLVSSAGLIAVTYGCIKAGQNGWGNATALATIAVGLDPAGPVRAGRAADHRPRRAVAGGPGAVQVGRVPVGHDPGDVPVVHDVRPVLRAAAVLPGRPRRRARSAAGCGCCRWCSAWSSGWSSGPGCSRSAAVPRGRRASRRPARGP